MKSPQRLDAIMPRARTHKLVVQDAGSEKLIYDVNTDKAISLNATAKFVWERCDGKTSISDVSDQLDRDMDSETRMKVVAWALKDLKKVDLLTEDYVLFDTDKSLSRREAITKYGIPLASLPLIASLVAPLSAQMGSCLPFGDPCTPGGTACCQVGGTITCQDLGMGPVCFD